MDMDSDNLPLIMGDRAHRLMEQAAQARREGRLADAKRGWTEAVSLCRHTGSRHDLITTLKGLGQIERELQNGDAALALYEEAVTLSVVAGEPLLLAHTIRHLGDIHLDAERLELAERCYDEAVARTVKMPSKRRLSISRTRFGRWQFSKNEKATWSRQSRFGRKLKNSTLRWMCPQELPKAQVTSHNFGWTKHDTPQNDGPAIILADCHRCCCAGK